MYWGPVGAGEGDMSEEERFESLNLEFECTPNKKNDSLQFFIMVA